MCRHRNEDVIAPLFPEGVITCEVFEFGDLPVLPAEAALAGQMGPERRREFYAGRYCARQALRRLRIGDFPIMVNEDRAPVWPPGCVGSITHTDGYCGVALTRRFDVASLGLDVQRIRPIDEQGTRLFCTPRELSWLCSQPSADQKRYAMLIFSAKECTYKCQYAISTQRLNPLDVEITPGGDSFRATLLSDIGGSLGKRIALDGRYLFHEDYVCTGMTLWRTGLNASHHAAVSV